MPATEAQVDSLKEDIRALSDTTSEILLKLDGLTKTVNSHGDRLDKVESRLDRVEVRLDKMDERFDKMDGRLDKMDGTLQEILTLVKRAS